MALLQFLQNLKKVYQPPSQADRHHLLNSPSTVAVIVARHPFIRLISAWNEKLNRNYQYGHSMFHREHNLRHYARDHVTSHYIRKQLVTCGLRA